MSIPCFEIMSGLLRNMTFTQENELLMIRIDLSIICLCPIHDVRLSVISLLHEPQTSSIKSPVTNEQVGRSPLKLPKGLFRSAVFKFVLTAIRGYDKSRLRKHVSFSKRISVSRQLLRLHISSHLMRGKFL